MLPRVSSVVDDEEDDLEPCYRHPKRLTAVYCSNCERPICPDCSIAAPVGIKCPECGTMPRSARAAVPTARLARAIVVGLAAALVFGVVRLFVPIPFLGLIIAWFLGTLVGQVTVWGAGGYRDVVIARAAAAVTFIGFMAPLLAALVPAARFSIGGGDIWFFIAAAAAAYGAYTRAISPR
jgi:hypothetical protein